MSLTHYSIVLRKQDGLFDINHIFVLVWKFQVHSFLCTRDPFVVIPNLDKNVWSAFRPQNLTVLFFSFNYVYVKLYFVATHLLHYWIRSNIN